MATTNSIGTSARDFSIIQTWEDAVPATPTGGYIGECYNDSEFSAGVVIAGHTTSSANFITLDCHSGESFQDNAGVRSNALIYDQTKGVGIVANPFSAGIIDVQNDWVTIQRLQIKRTTGSYAFGPIECSASITNSLAKNCICQKTYNGTAFIVNLRETPAINVIAIDTGGGTTTAFSTVNLTPAPTLLNCTAVRDSALGAGGTGFQASAAYSGSIAKNCASFGWTSAFSATGWATSSDYNCADDASTPGTGGHNQASKTYANQFQSTSNDFRLKSGSDCIDHGNTDATLAPNDISNTARGVGTAGDIGVWEFVAAGGATTGWGKLLAGDRNAVIYNG